MNAAKTGCAVLVAEDDVSSRDLLTACLVKWGHDVVACEDGGRAWAVLQQPDAPRLVVLDWMMPEVDGPELCRRIRTLDRGSLMYVILLTSRDSPDDIVAGLEAGADDYIVKPFDRKELRARLKVGQRLIALQQKLVEAERYRVLTQAAGAAAHEINQPLSVLLLTADMMLRDLPLDDPKRESIEAFRVAARRIDAIVQKMLSIRQVVTQPYLEGVEIIDFDASSRSE